MPLTYRHSVHYRQAQLTLLDKGVEVLRIDISAQDMAKKLPDIPLSTQASPITEQQRLDVYSQLKRTQYFHLAQCRFPSQFSLTLATQLHAALTKQRAVLLSNRDINDVSLPLGEVHLRCDHNGDVRYAFDGPNGGLKLPYERIAHVTVIT